MKTILEALAKHPICILIVKKVLPATLKVQADNMEQQQILKPTTEDLN